MLLAAEWKNSGLHRHDRPRKMSSVVALTRELETRFAAVDFT